MAAGVTAGSGLVTAVDRQEKPHPHGATRFLHVLPEKPHHRIYGNANPMHVKLGVKKSPLIDKKKRERGEGERERGVVTFKALLDPIGALLPGHAGVGIGGLDAGAHVHDGHGGLLPLHHCVRLSEAATRGKR